MSEFVPIHIGAVLVVKDPLVDWLRSWAGAEAQRLEATEWFTVGQDLGEGGKPNADGIWIPEYSTGTYIWRPAPAGAKGAVEELRCARHKQQKSTHVFICPRLMAYLWQCELLKEADLVFHVPTGAGVFWPTSCHEPLIVGVCLPFISK